MITRRLLRSQIRRNERTRSRGSTGRPLRVVNTRPVSCQAEDLAVGGLLLLAGEQGGAGLSRDGQVPVACPGLKQTGPKLSAHPPDLLADSQQACVQVDISPAQAEDLAAAHAVQQQEGERRVERIRLGCPEKGQGLVS